MNWDQVLKQLEPAAAAFDYDRGLVVSQAVSMKRIADALEKNNELLARSIALTAPFYTVGVDPAGQTGGSHG